jgi:hypothetical protein
MTRTRAWLHGLVTGCLIGTGFGVGWWVFGSASLPGAAGAITLVAGIAVAVLLVACCAVLLRRGRRLPADQGSSPFGRRYALVVAAMVVAIVAGSEVLRYGGLPRAVPAWVLFVVGLHFVAFVRILRTPVFGLLAAMMCAVAVAGAVLGAAGVPAGWDAVIGFGGAACLWIHVVIGLLTGRRALG